MADFRSRIAKDAQLVDCTDTVDIISYASNKAVTTFTGIIGVLRVSAAKHLRSFSNASIQVGDEVFTIPANNLPAGYDPTIGDQIRDAAGKLYTSKDINSIAFNTSYRFLCTPDDRQ